MTYFKPDDWFLVTGASSGLGRSISEKICDLGAKVVGVGRNEEGLKKTAELIAKTNDFFYELKDLSKDFETFDSWIKRLAEKYGKFKGFVSSAGIQYTMPIQVDNVEKSKDLFNINFFSNLQLLKSFPKKKNIKDDGASIVIISSFTSLLGVSATSSYSASKSALNSLVRTVAIELSKNKIRVNSVLPGHVMTEMFSKSGNEKLISNLQPKYPLGLGEPDDVANTVCFLLSDLAKWITGTEIVVDGGASIYF